MPRPDDWNITQDPAIDTTDAVRAFDKNVKNDVDAERDAPSTVLSVKRYRDGSFVGEPSIFVRPPRKLTLEDFMTDGVKQQLKL